MTAEVLVAHIVATHHRYLWDRAAEGRRRWSARSCRCTVSDILSWSMNASCFAKVRADLEPHMLREERMLFPMIRELATATGVPSINRGSLRTPISVMLSEHDAVGHLFALLHTLTDGYTPPATGARRYVACFAAMAELEADTHMHIHKENNVLFPLVARLEAERSI